MKLLAIYFADRNSIGLIMNNFVEASFSFFATKQQTNGLGSIYLFVVATKASNYSR